MSRTAMRNTSMPFGARSSFANKHVAERLRKVPVIVAAFQRDGVLNGQGGRLLDIGAGAGVIGEAVAANLGATCVQVDAQDHRILQGPPFVLALGECLPFGDESFDLVVANHVIEHVGDQLAFLREILRVLKPGGRCYVATPSKYTLLEPHYKLPLLSWFPKSAADGLVRLFKKGDAYNVNPLTRQALQQLSNQAGVRTSELTQKFIKQPRLFGRLGPGIRTVSMLPCWLIGLLLPLVPTHVWLLHKNIPQDTLYEGMHKQSTLPLE